VTHINGCGLLQLNSNEDCTKTQYPRYQALPSILTNVSSIGEDTSAAPALPSTSSIAIGNAITTGVPAKKKEGPELEALASSVALAAARDAESKAPLVAAGVTKAKEIHRKAGGPRPKPLDDGTPHHRDIRYREKRSDIELVDDVTHVDIHANKTKVNRICDVIIEVLNNIDNQHTRYLLSLLTAHVMKSPPDLTAALTIIRSIRVRERGGRAATQPVIALREAPKAQGHGALPVDDDEEESKAAVSGAIAANKPSNDDDDEDLPVLSISSSTAAPATVPASTSTSTRAGVVSTSSISSSSTKGSSKTSESVTIFTKPATGGAGGLSGDACLKYVIFLADVNQLFDAALSMYDFDMVMQVAQHSQKDPKEYIPFLSRLQSLAGPYQRYSIDLHLKNYSSALSNLHAAITSSTSQSDANDWFTACRQLVTKQGPLLSQAVRLFAPKAVFGEQKDEKKASSTSASSNGSSNTEHSLASSVAYLISFLLALPPILCYAR
jgi:hypothetical protein